MSDPKEFDVVILGGGMTGLTLAHHLVQSEHGEPAPPLKTLVIEPRSTYHRDKTWCYWQLDEAPFDAAITHKWSRWSVSCGGETHISENLAAPYVRVDSGKFYDLAQSSIAASDDVELRLDTHATDITNHTDGFLVHSSADTVQAKRVFDTRPVQTPAGTLLQHFVGWEIETTNDVFDPTTVTLMDFATAADDIHFFYVLPFSPRHALVETTHFSTTVLEDATYAAEISGYLEKSLGVSEWRVLHEEKGVIPMPRRAPNLACRSHPNLIPLGLHSDTAKPSTGYCYPHAQRQAYEQIKALLADANCDASAARSKLTRWFDAVFIGFLEQHPERAGEIFLRLFKQVPSGALIRFLGDKAQPADYVRVMTALPKKLFIRQALRHVSQP